MIRYKRVWIHDCPKCFVDVHGDSSLIQRLPGQRILARVVTELGLDIDICLRWCACPTEQLMGPVERP